jgi:hypothetical protein
LGRIRTSVSLRYGFEKYANALRASLFCCAGRDIRRPGGQRLQMRVPSGFRQEDSHTQDALQCALDFHVEAGQHRNATPVIPVLIRIPGIPAPAQRICVRVRALKSGFDDTGVCAAAMPADARQARMTAANRAIIPGHELPQTLARRCRM